MGGRLELTRSRRAAGVSPAVAGPPSCASSRAVGSTVLPPRTARRTDPTRARRYTRPALRCNSSMQPRPALPQLRRQVLCEERTERQSGTLHGGDSAASIFEPRSVAQQPSQRDGRAIIHRGDGEIQVLVNAAIEIQPAGLDQLHHGESGDCFVADPIRVSVCGPMARPVPTSARPISRLNRTCPSLTTTTTAPVILRLSS